MPLLPDLQRPQLLPPARTLAATLVHVLRAAAWHGLHPELRERFVEAPPSRPLIRLYYETVDGWTAPVFYIPPRPGGVGEPVVLAHALGLGADSFRVGQTASLVNQLTQAGFAVYLLTHRGDRDALPRQGRHSFDVDTILEQDIPSALDRILGHSGAKQVHWVGHGFGGILGLAWLARMGAEAQIASFVSLSAPVLFETPRSEGRLSSLALAMMPSRWRLPTRTLAKWMSPWLDGEQNLFGVTLPGVTDGPRLRSACTYSVEDIPLGLLRQISHWLREGTLTDRSGSLHYAEALCKIDIPLLVIASPADELCPVHAAKVVRDCWGGDDTRCLELNEDYGHMDVILGRDAPQDVFRPIVEWLEGHRSACWLNGRTVEAERLAVEG